MKAISRAMTALPLIIACALPALASPALPEALKGIAGVTYEGQTAGLDSWSIDGNEMLWFTTPDGQGVVSGFLFNSRGQDIGSAMIGEEPIHLDEFLEMTALPDEAAFGNAGFPQGDDAARADPVLMDGLAPEPIAVESLGEAPAARPDIALSDLSGKAATAPMRGFDSILEMIDGPGNPGATNEILASLDEAGKSAVMIRLVELLRDVKTETEFRDAVIAWRLFVSETADAVGNETLGQVFDPETATASSEEVATADVPEGSSIFKAAAAASANLYDETARGTMWFSIGAQAAPVVYAYIDPTCPFCAKAIRDIKPQIDAGKIQLRVVIAPVLSERSRDVASALMMKSNPVEAFIAHELDFAKNGTYRIDDIPVSSVPEDLSGGLRANFDMAVKHKLPGVPFFVFRAAEGDRYVSGLPAADAFDGALPDSFTGNH